MPTALFISTTDDPTLWLPRLAADRPDLAVRVWPEIGDPASIDYAFAWKPPPGILGTLPNLKVIYSLGAGVDALLRDATLPRRIPLVRMVDVSLTDGMVEYVVWQVLDIHRRGAAYRAQQARATWHEEPQALARDVAVGILGAGVLGTACARALAGLNFQVATWSRTAKVIPGVASFAGEGGLESFLARSRIVVCLLPLTPETEGILGAKLFARLPAGAWVINAGRGGHQIERDVLAAADGGHLGGFVLDVFSVEPLPPDHPFWRHPKIVVTPHNAAGNNAAYAVPRLLDQIARYERGEPMLDVVDFAQGY
jgi:glyoxylate/hydroxypyruvate reductase A